MPIYEYECVSCGHRFEQYQSFKDAPLTTCPQCGKALRKLLQPVGIVFKGSGWYINDSRSSETAKEKSPAESKKDTTAPATPSESSPSTSATNTSSSSDTTAKAAAS